MKPFAVIRFFENSNESIHDYRKKRGNSKSRVCYSPGLLKQSSDLNIDRRKTGGEGVDGVNGATGPKYI